MKLFEDFMFLIGRVLRISACLPPANLQFCNVADIDSKCCAPNLNPIAPTLGNRLSRTAFTDDSSDPNNNSAMRLYFPGGHWSPGIRRSFLIYVRSLLQHNTLRMALFLSVFCMAFGGAAYSQVTPAGGFTPPDDTPALKVGMTFYGNYTYQPKPKITDADGNVVSPNSFDVTRSYLNFTGNLSHIVAFRLTPDITRATVTGATASFNNSLVFRVKYAYAQFNLDDWSKNWTQTWVRIGANQTPYVDWDEGVYRYRFQGTVFTERVGRLTSSDFGISFHTNFPHNYGEIHTGMYNGEGYFVSEVNNMKAFQTRVTIRPLATGGMTMRGLRLTGFYDKDNYAKGLTGVGDVKERFVFKALFEHPHIVASFDYMDASDRTTAAAALLHGRGYSIWATPIFKQKGNGPELLLRWDSYEPSRGNPSQKQNLSIVGASYWFPHQGTVSASLLADVENTTFTGGLATPAVRKYALHALLNF